MVEIIRGEAWPKCMAKGCFFLKHRINFNKYTEIGFTPCCSKSDFFSLHNLIEYEMFFIKQDSYMLSFFEPGIPLHSHNHTDVDCLNTLEKARIQVLFSKQL